MRLLTCAADDCTETFEFDPVNPLKKFHSVQCQTRTRLRRWRKSKRCGGGDGGGGGKQRRLFARPVLAKAKPPKHAPVAEPTLFETELHATFGGAVEYGQPGSVSDKSRYSVKSACKPAESVPAEAAAA
jgi:hypothetical protein